jgi:hypothetical protein
MRTTSVDKKNDLSHCRLGVAYILHQTLVLAILKDFVCIVSLLCVHT